MKVTVTIEHDDEGTRFSLPADPMLALGLLELAKAKVVERLILADLKNTSRITMPNGIKIDPGKLRAK